MSDDAQNTPPTQTYDPSASSRIDGIPDSLWRRVLEAGQAASQAPAASSPPDSPRAELSESARYAQMVELSSQLELAVHGDREPSVVDNDDDETALLITANNPRMLEGAIAAELQAGAARAEDTTWLTATHHRSRAELEDGMRRLEEAMRTAELARAALPQRPLNAVDGGTREHAMSYLDRARREGTLGYLDRQEEFRQRSRHIQELRGAGLIPTSSNTSSIAPPTASTPHDPAVIVERSTTARRDLERALRDYRIARRNLRTHYSIDSTSSADQNIPPDQMAALPTVEQTRARIRARGQSRSSTLDRTDAIVDSIAAVTGVENDAWRSDDDGDTVIGLQANSANVHNEIGQSYRSQGRRNTLPARDTGAPEPYLGPTSNIRGTGSITGNGSMRDYYRRIEERIERPASRSGPAAIARINSFIANAPIRSSVSAATANRQEPANDQGQRSHDTSRRPDDTVNDLQVTKVKPPFHFSKRRAKVIMRYLSALKNMGNDVDQSLAWAKQYDIDSLLEIFTREAEVDLPLRIDEVARPPFSSFLESGMSWEGIQKGGYIKSDAGMDHMMGGPSTEFATGPLFQSTSNDEERILALRAWRHRERIQIERRRAHESGQIDLSSDSLAAQIEERNRGLLESFSNPLDGMDTLADVERHLTDLLEEEERRATGGDEWTVSSVNYQPRPITSAAVVQRSQPHDQWPVKITLHEVDWHNMKVSGTMVASPLGDFTRAASVPTSTSQSANGNRGNLDGKGSFPSTMETLFDGEIIDFHTHELETLSDKPGYMSGGLVTDLKYWSRIGPFKGEVQKKLQVAKDKRRLNTYSKLGLAGTLDEQREEYRRTFKVAASTFTELEELDRDEVGTIVYDTMAECLSSRKWIEKMFGESGWVLMRWKERCFITPLPTAPAVTTENVEAQAPVIINQYARANSRANTSGESAATGSNATTSNQVPADQANWGLTIRGFYYVAMHRMTGKIEGLYYDNGSQPYQQLSCIPTGTFTTSEARPVTRMNEGHNEDDKEESTEAGASGDDDLDMSFMSEIGIRRDFGVWGFR